MNIRTNKEYPCFNYVIPTDISFTNNSIRLILGEPHLPGGDSGICLDAIGPATSHVTFPDLSGTFVLTLVWDQTVDQYSLRITEELISIAPIIARKTTPLHQNLWRYPKNSVEVHCSSSDTSKPCEQLYLRLQRIREFDEFEFGAEAVNPYYRGDKFYIYENDETVRELDSVITNFRRQSLNPITGFTGFTIWLNDINRNMYWPR